MKKIKISSTLANIIVEKKEILHNDNLQYLKDFGGERVANIYNPTGETSRYNDNAKYYCISLETLVGMLFVLDNPSLLTISRAALTSSISQFKGKRCQVLIPTNNLIVGEEVLVVEQNGRDCEVFTATGRMGCRKSTLALIEEEGSDTKLTELKTEVNGIIHTMKTENFQFVSREGLLGTITQ